MRLRAAFPREKTIVWRCVPLGDDAWRAAADGERSAAVLCEEQLATARTQIETLRQELATALTRFGGDRSAHQAALK